MACRMWSVTVLVGLGALTGGGLWLWGPSPAATQDEASAKPRLFALRYAEGHDLAGFVGKAMVLVFGDSRVAGWDEFLVECESDARVSKLLTETLQGAFVDAAKEPDASATYGDPSVGTVLVKDLHGPIRGRLQGEYTCADLATILENALPEVRVEKSPAYWQLQNGTDLLDELIAKEVAAEAARVLKLFRQVEPGTKPLEYAHSCTGLEWCNRSL